MSLFFVQKSHMYASLGGKVQDAISITAGNKKCVKLVVPSMGFMEKLVVSQVPSGSGGGASVAFTVELLNSVLPFAEGETAVATAAAAPLEHHRIPPPVDAPLAASAGAVVSYVDPSYGIGYVNADGTYAANQNAVYLIINPTSAAGTTKWNILLSGRTSE